MGLPVHVLVARQYSHYIINGVAIFRIFYVHTYMYVHACMHGDMLCYILNDHTHLSNTNTFAGIHNVDSSNFKLKNPNIRAKSEFLAALYVLKYMYMYMYNACICMVSGLIVGVVLRHIII